MKSLIRQLIAACMIAVVGFAIAAPTAVWAQTRQELKERFKQRDPEITRLKSEGKVGETWEGFVEVVSKDKPLSDKEKKLVEEENADRRLLYEDIARKSEVRETAAEVGINNGMRNFSLAKPGEYLKVRTGPWVTRGEVGALKQDGKVGETWRGYIEAVTDKAADEPRVAAVIAAENIARKYIYERQARNRKTSLDHEEERAGRQKIDSAKSGEYIKDKDGKWQKKK